MTSAGYADLYVVSCGSTSGVAGEVDMYAVPAGTAGLQVAGRFVGLGLRGNASAPMTVAVEIPAAQRMGDVAGGFAMMMQTVLPWFNLGNAAVSVGLAASAQAAALTHVSGTRLEHLGESLAQLPTIRAQIARTGIALATQRAYLRLAAEQRGHTGRQHHDPRTRRQGIRQRRSDGHHRVGDAGLRRRRLLQTTSDRAGISRCEGRSGDGTDR